MALAAEHALDYARDRLHRFFNGKSPERWVFTLNGTGLRTLGKSGVPETWLFKPPDAPKQTQRT